MLIKLLSVIAVVVLLMTIMVLALDKSKQSAETASLVNDSAGNKGKQVKEERKMGKVSSLSFFKNCAFVSVDFQPGDREGSYLTNKAMSEDWKKMGFTAADCNAAIDFLYDVAQPNARKIADACRDIKLPMIFIHWGYQFRDGMDLTPEIRRSFIQSYGMDYKKWPHHISHPTSRPAEFFDIRNGEYVIAKTDQDAFTSSNIGFVLRNLEIENIVFVGGHTGACLARTAEHAKELGYHILCVEDATWDATESNRIPNLLQSNYDYILTTDKFLKLVNSLTPTNTKSD